MNYTVLKKYNVPNCESHKFVYKKCNNCGQIICDTEFDGSIFIATNCPNCNIPFVSESEKLKHDIMTAQLVGFFKREMIIN